MNLHTPAEIQMRLAKAFKARRLGKNHSQVTASERSGVPVPTLKRFERTGEISLRQFLMLVDGYGDLDTAEQIFPEPEPMSLDELFDRPHKNRQRGNL